MGEFQITRMGKSFTKGNEHAWWLTFSLNWEILVSKRFSSKLAKYITVIILSFALDAHRWG